MFIFPSTFFPRRKKVAKNRRSGQNLRFSLRTQLPRDARRSPIGEWSGYRVFTVSQRRHPTPAAERLGAHTALVDRWEVGLIVPAISSNIETIALTFRGKILYGRKLSCRKKHPVSMIVLVKNNVPCPFAVRTVGSQMRLVKNVF